jgi:hypothetical protein
VASVGQSLPDVFDESTDEASSSQGEDEEASGELGIGLADSLRVPPESEIQISVESTAEADLFETWSDDEDQMLTSIKRTERHDLTDAGAEDKVAASTPRKLTAKLVL